MQQHDGKQYVAANFRFNNTSNLATVSMDIANAYPAAAAVEKWNRTITLNRTKNEISLIDQAVLKEYKAPTELNFLTPLNVEIKKGKLLFQTGLILHFDEHKFEAKIDEQQVDDVRLAAAWGSKIYRIRLITKLKEKSSEYKILISQSIN